MFKGIRPIVYAGREVLPLIEGGKGVSATNHASSGAWAAAGGIGTVSAVNADSYDPEGRIIPQIYHALTRRDRHEELINYAIDGAVEQVRRAYEIAGGHGAININVLWEMGGAQRVLHGVLERTRGLVSGVTCGAGMPYKLSEIAASYGVSYLPIISSARAFRALWKRSYSKVADLMAANPGMAVPSGKVIIPFGNKVNSTTYQRPTNQTTNTPTTGGIRVVKAVSGDTVAKIAARCMVGQKLGAQGVTREIVPRYDRSPGGASFDVQTLTLRPGAAGYRLDVAASVPLIDVALRDPVNRSVVLPVEGADGRGPGLDVLRQMIIGYLDAQGFIFDGQSTVASVYVMDLETGEEMNINSDVAMSAASTAKVSILLDYFRNLLGTPSRDEAFLMSQSLLCSNNSSSNLLMQLIGNSAVASGEAQIGSDTIFNGLQNIVETNQYLGLRNTFITAPFDLGDNSFVTGSVPAPVSQPNPNFNTSPDPFNQVTTEDLGTAFTMIYDCAYTGSGLMTAYPDGEFNQTE